MLPEKLKDFDYYLKKLPLYVRNSYGIKEHFEILYDLMMTIESIQKEILDCFDLMNEDYIAEVIAKYDAPTADSFSFLDMIASLYGISRDLDVQYIKDGQQIAKSLHLSNEELFLLVKARIIQNNYDGSYKQAIDYYRSIGLNVQMFFDTTEAAKCDIFLDLSTSSINKTVQELFLSGLLTLKSIGIMYNAQIASFASAAIWDSTDKNRQWDSAKWL